MKWNYEDPEGSFLFVVLFVLFTLGLLFLKSFRDAVRSLPGVSGAWEAF